MYLPNASLANGFVAVGVDIALNEPLKLSHLIIATRLHFTGYLQKCSPEFLEKYESTRDLRDFKLEYFSRYFRRLVLGCMDSYDSESRLIFEHFSKSTISAFFCTAPVPEIRQIWNIEFSLKL